MLSTGSAGNLTPTRRQGKARHGKAVWMVGALEYGGLFVVFLSKEIKTSNGEKGKERKKKEIKKVRKALLQHHLYLGGDFGFGG